jgi:hypothetical protein
MFALSFVHTRGWRSLFLPPNVSKLLHLDCEAVGKCYLPSQKHGTFSDSARRGSPFSFAFTG